MQRSSVTEYIVSDISRSLKAEHTAAQHFTSKIIRTIKKRIKRQQEFTFIIPEFKLKFRPYHLDTCTRMSCHILRQLGLNAIQEAVNKIYISIDVDINKMISKFEQSIVRSISDNLITSYEKIGLARPPPKYGPEKISMQAFAETSRRKGEVDADTPVVSRVAEKQKIENMALRDFFNSDTDTDDITSTRSAKFDDFLDI